MTFAILKERGIFYCRALQKFRFEAFAFSDGILCVCGGRYRRG